MVVFDWGGDDVESMRLFGAGCLCVWLSQAKMSNVNFMPIV